VPRSDAHDERRKCSVMMDVVAQSKHKTTDDTPQAQPYHTEELLTLAVSCPGLVRGRPWLLVGVQWSGGGWKKKEAGLLAGRDASVPVWPVYLGGRDQKGEDY
jgi:hypothetical protein